MLAISLDFTHKIIKFVYIESQALLALNALQADELSLKPLIERLAFASEMDAEKEHSDQGKELEGQGNFVPAREAFVTVLLGSAKEGTLGN